MTSLERRYALIFPRYVVFCLQLLLFVVTSVVALSPYLASLYAQGRRIRALEGHEAAVPLYQEIRKRHPGDRTAATWIAACPEGPQYHAQLGKLSQEQHHPSTTLPHLTHLLQATCLFTPQDIANLVFATQPSQRTKALHSSAPLYLQPLAAGSPVPPLPTNALSTCIQLFLLAVTLPYSTCRNYLGAKLLEGLQSLGIVVIVHEQQLVVPFAHVLPVQTPGTVLYLVTDLHPTVLSQTTVSRKNDGAVMYIGPDSLALLDHWTTIAAATRQRQVANTTTTTNNNNNNMEQLVDIGTGSGIQALAYCACAAATSRQCSTKTSSPIRLEQITCVDINPRALRLTRLNFLWNGLLHHQQQQQQQTLKFVLGDVLQDTGRQVFFDDTDDDMIFGKQRSWQELLGRPTTILANPPFLPVPTILARRHGWFSNGGTSGDAILKRIVELASASSSMHPNRLYLAIVSEFMNPDTQLAGKLAGWWNTTTTPRPAEAILITNQPPMDHVTYALRRANDDDDASEMQTWKQHLEDEDISHVSPGLLFVRTRDAAASKEDAGELMFALEHVRLEKTNEGSLWTPTNLNGRLATRNVLLDRNFVSDE